jgi:predicted amidophosphoribosyltransferase
MINSFRACAHCSQLFASPNVFCNICWEQMHRIQNAGPSMRQWAYTLPTYSLFTWRKERQIESLIYALKDGGLEDAFDRLAMTFLNQLESRPRLQDHLFIPSPARAPGRCDHAFEWARALAKFTGGRMEAPLLRKSQEPQKRLRREERMEKKMSLSKDLSLISKGPVIFVDDVITTGATAYAAHEALQRPQNFETWTISCRPEGVLL